MRATDFIAVEVHREVSEEGGVVICSMGNFDLWKEGAEAKNSKLRFVKCGLHVGKLSRGVSINLGNCWSSCYAIEGSTLCRLISCLTALGGSIRRLIHPIDQTLQGLAFLVIRR